jgi:hypothetical protein
LSTAFFAINLSAALAFQLLAFCAFPSLSNRLGFVNFFFARPAFSARSVLRRFNQLIADLTESQQLLFVFSRLPITFALDLC